MKNFTKAIASLALVMSGISLYGQAPILTEQFSGATFPPTGWTNVNVGGNATDDWDFVTFGTNPSCNPHSAPNMARFNTFNFSGFPPTKADLVTPVMNFSSVSNVIVGFWMYRDNPGWTNSDQVKVYVDTVNNVNNNSTLLGTIFRAGGMPPLVNIDGWYYYQFNIPANYNGTHNYVIFEGSGGWGNNIFIDDISIFPQGANDVKVASVDQPLGGPVCYSSTQQVAVTISNAGTAPQSNIPVGVVISGAGSQTLTGTYAGPLAPGASYSYTFSATANMLASGTYYMKGYTANAGDNNINNDTLPMTAFTVFPTYTAPMAENFNSSFSVPNDWYLSSGWIDAMHGKGPSNGIAMEMNWNNTYEITLPKVTGLTANSVFDFDYRVIDYQWPYPNPGGTPATFNNDSINVMISTDCGASFNMIYSINAATQNTSNTFASITLPLASYAGQTIIIKFVGKWDNGDYYFDLDNVNIRTMVATDAGVTGLVNPTPTSCFSSSVPIVVNVKNFSYNLQSNIPVTALVTSATSQQTLSGTFTSTLPSNTSGVLVLGNANMSAPGTYTISVYSTLSGDGVNSNDTMQTEEFDVAANLTYEDFNNSGTAPLGWQISNQNQWADFAVHQVVGITPGINNTPAMACELWSGHNSSYFVAPRVHVTTDSSVLFFRYRIINASNASNPGGTPTLYGPNDSLMIEASTNCGTSYMPVYSINMSNHIISNDFKAVNVCLGSVINNDIMLRVRAVWGAGDYIVAIDSLGLVAPSFTVSNSGPLCVSGSTVQLVSNPPTGGSFSGPGVTGTTFSPAAVGVGTYSVGLAYCTSFHQIPVKVVTPAVTTTVSAAPCSGGTVTVHAGNAGYYVWSTGETTDSIIVAPAASTVYTVTGTYDNGCTAVATPTANILQNPVININVSSSVCASTTMLPMTATPTGGTFSGVGVVGSDFYPLVMGPGTYTVTYNYTGVNGCSSTGAAFIQVLNCTGVEEVEGINFSLAPNPNNGEVSIKLNTANTANTAISVYDAVGKLVLQQALNATETKLNTSELKPGVYFYMISGDQSTVIGRGKMIRQ